MKLPKLFLCTLLALTLSKDSLAREFILKREKNDTFITEIVRDSPNFESKDSPILKSPYKFEDPIAKSSSSRMAYSFAQIKNDLSNGTSLEDSINQLSQLTQKVNLNSTYVEYEFGNYKSHVLHMNSDMFKKALLCVPTISFSEYDGQNVLAHTIKGEFNYEQNFYVNGTLQFYDFLVSKYTSKSKPLIETVFKNFNLEELYAAIKCNSTNNNQFEQISQIKYLYENSQKDGVYRFIPLLFLNDSVLKKQLIFSIKETNLDIVVKDYHARSPEDNFSVLRLKDFFSEDDFNLIKSQNQFNDNETLLYFK